MIEIYLFLMMFPRMNLHSKLGPVHTENANMYGLLTKLFRSRWLDIGLVHFFCVLMDRDGVEVHKLAKKERGQYPAILTKKVWSIKDYYLALRKIFRGTRWVVPSGQDSSILAARVVNLSARFGSSCPLTELAI